MTLHGVFGEYCFSCLLLMCLIRRTVLWNSGGRVVDCRMISSSVDDVDSIGGCGGCLVDRIVKGKVTA